MKRVKGYVSLAILAICLCLAGCLPAGRAGWTSPWEDRSPEKELPSPEEEEEGIQIVPMERLEEFTFDRAAVLAERAGAVIVNVGCGAAEKAVGMTSGSGVVYEERDGRLCIVTAAHVLRESEAGFYWIKYGEMTADCDDWRIAQDCDLAFLWVPVENLQEETAKQLQTAVWDKETYDLLTSGDTVLCLGKRAGETLVCEGTLEDAWIYAEDFAQYMMVANCPVYPGMSGGALCDEYGNLIGIVCGGNDSGELAAVPLGIVQARYEE